MRENVAWLVEPNWIVFGSHATDYQLRTFYSGGAGPTQNGRPTEQQKKKNCCSNEIFFRWMSSNTIGWENVSSTGRTCESFCFVFFFGMFFSKSRLPTGWLTDQVVKAIWLFPLIGTCACRLQLGKWRRPRPVADFVAATRPTKFVAKNK